MFAKEMRRNDQNEAFKNINDQNKIFKNIKSENKTIKT